MSIDISTISEEAFFPRRPVEMAVVAFPEGNYNPVVLWVVPGSGLYEEFSNLGNDVAEYICSSSEDNPDEGIWIWQGTISVHRNYDGEYDVDYNHVCWRKPSFKEWQSIMQGNNPFKIQDEQPKIDWGKTHKTGL